METYARENALRKSNASGTASSAHVTHAVDAAVGAALKGALSPEAAKRKLVLTLLKRVVLPSSLSDYLYSVYVYLPCGSSCINVEFSILVWRCCVET